jgi:hypothetical protein
MTPDEQNAFAKEFQNEQNKELAAPYNEVMAET